MIWPQPKLIESSDTVYTINPSTFKITKTTTEPCEVLDAAIQRYRNITLLDRCQSIGTLSDDLRPSQVSSRQRSSGKITQVKVTVAGDCEKWPSDGMIESYTLQIPKSGTNDIHLTSPSVWGILRGLESLSQLIYPSDSTNGLFMVNAANVTDSPRFTFRGLMIDTSRHFIPVRVLLQNLDAMSYNKLNVFHWHLTDDNSFPYVSKRFPDLSGKGSYTPSHVYTKEDISLVINYARLRGIRVIPEFDTPGHVNSWKGQPGLLTKCFPETYDEPPKATDIIYSPIDVTEEGNYAFMREFFTEVASDFPDNYIHLGGDEVTFGVECWKSNAKVTAFMKEHGIETYEQLEAVYVDKLVKIIESMNRTYIVWQEVADSGIELTRDAIIDVWKSGWPSEVANVTAQGYRVIVSAPWYLNYIHYGVDWPALYRADPQQFTGDDDQKSLVIGGEACVWTEFVDSAAIISRTWPRASAVSERLWSPQSVNKTETAHPRIRHMHCLMQKRGLRVEPLDGPGYCPCDVVFN